MAPKGVRKASQERLGSLSELPSAPRDCLESPRKWHGMPGRVPESARQRFGAVKIDAKSCPGAQKASFCGTALLRSAVIANFRRFVCDFQVFRKVFEPSKVPRLLAKSRVRLFALRVASLARRCLEKRRKSIPKSTENRQDSTQNCRKSCLGPSRAPLSTDFCRSCIEGSRNRGIERSRNQGF